MQPSDPFPIERCSSRLRKAILAEFEGRTPIFQDILSIPLNKWMAVPGMGPRLLRELESIIHSKPPVPQSEPSPKSDDAEFIARLERFQHDLQRLQHDIQALLGQTRLRKADTNGSDMH